VTGLWTGQLRNHHSNPDRGKRFFLDQLCGHPASYSVGASGHALEQKWRGREVGRSLPPRAEVQNVQSYTSTSLYAFVVYTRIMLPSCYGLLLSAVAFPFVVSYCVTSYSSTVSLPVCLLLASQNHIV